MSMVRDLTAALNRSKSGEVKVMQFRKEALARVQTQEALDLPVRLTSPRGWIALAVVSMVVVGGAAWGMTASLPRAIEAGGLMTSARGSFAVQTATAGQVTQVFLRLGDEVIARAPVVRLAVSNRSVLVRAPARGRVFSLRVRVGQVVEAGSTLAVAERSGEPADRTVAAVFLPESSSAAVRVGDRVDLRVESVPVTSFGVLRGRVASVDPYVSSRRDIAEFLGDEDLSQALTNGEPARRVLVSLDRSTSTVSGYAWSTRTGPSTRLALRSKVHAHVQQPPVRPVEWVFPQ